MTNDPTRATGPETTPQPAPATAETWYATPEPTVHAGSVPSFIPAGIGAKATPVKPSGRTSLVTVALVAAALIAAAGVGFAGGRVTAPAQAGNGRGQGFGNGAGFPNASGRPGGGFGGAFAAGSSEISGSVVAIGNGTITIQPAGGSGTVEIAVPSTATYHAQGAASATDVAIGTQVHVTVNRPQFRGGPDASGAPGGAANASPGPSGAPGGSGVNLTATDILVTGK